MFELKARLQVRSTLVHCVVQVQGKILDTNHHRFGLKDIQHLTIQIVQFTTFTLLHKWTTHIFVILNQDIRIKSSPHI